MRIKQIISALLTSCMVSSVLFVPAPSYALSAVEEEGSSLGEGGDPAMLPEDLFLTPSDPTPDPAGEATMAAALDGSQMRARIEHRFGGASQCQAFLIALDVVGGYGGGGLPRILAGTLTCVGRTLYRVW